MGRGVVNKTQAKRIAFGYVASDLAVALDQDSWFEQGAMDEYSDEERERILAAAYAILTDLRRRCGEDG